MVWETFDVKNDKAFQRFAKRQMPKSTEKRFITNLGNYAKFNEMSLEDLIEEAKDEELNKVPLKWRKIYSRLLDFRTYLIEEKQFSKNTVDTNMTSVKTFYNESRIELPKLPRINDREYQKDIDLEYEELPGIEYARTVLQGKSTEKHKALVATAYSNGLLRKDLANLVFKQLAEGLADYTGGRVLKNAQEVIDIFDGKTENFILDGEEVQVIAVLKCQRSKTKENFYAPITPECLQLIINWFKRKPHLKENDRLFQLAPAGVGKAFKTQNDRYNWGLARDGERVFITRHIRSWVSSTIEDTVFADYIEGRKVNRIREAYYRRPRYYVRNEYKKHLHKLGILVDYSEKKMSDELDEMTKKYKDISQKYNELLNQNTSTNIRLDNVEKTQKEIVDKIDKEWSYKEISDTVRKYAMKNENKLANLLNFDKFDYKLITYAIDLAKKDNVKCKFKDDEEYLNKLYIRSKNNRIFNPELSDELEKESIGKLEYTSKIYEIFLPMANNCTNYMKKIGIQLDESQNNELSKHLKSYAKYLYNNDEEEDNEYILSLVKAIALDEIDEFQLIK